MSESREPKRQRLVLPDERRNSVAAASVASVASVASLPPSDDSSAVSITDDSPSVEKIEQTLCRIGDKEKNSEDEVLGALGKLKNWTRSEDQKDRCDFFNKFIALGGIYRLLTFLNNPDNIHMNDNKEYVVLLCL